MKIVKMSLISWQGKIINEWSVPYARRHDALDHAMDRAEKEDQAGVMWSVFNNGETKEFAFDSHDPYGLSIFAKTVLPYMTSKGLDVNRLLREGGKPTPEFKPKEAKRA